jgi:hypothetical protein
LQRALGFDARKLVAEAEVDAGPERQMPVRRAFEVEALRMSFRTKRGFVNCTGETNRSNSSTAKMMRPQSAGCSAARATSDW